MTKRLFLILISCALGGCAGKEEARSEFDFTAFRQRELSGTVWLSDELEMPERLCVADDKLLVVNGMTPKLISVYDLPTRSSLGSFLSEGRAENEVLAIDQIHYDAQKKQVTVNDLLSRKLLIYAQRDLDHPQRIVPRQIIRTKSMCDYLFVLKDGRRAYVPARLDAPHRIELADSLGNGVYAYAPYPPLDGRPTGEYGYEIFMPQLVMNRAEDRIAVFSKNATGIDIYSLDGELLSSRSGPESFSPAYVVESQGDRLSVRPVRDKARMAYFNPVDRDGTIWVMYNGGSRAERRSSNCILTFDWDGAPRDRFLVEDGLIDFDVDARSRTIHALHRTAEGVDKIISYPY